MSEPYTPTEQELIEGAVASEAEVRRGIARIKAEAWDEGAAYVNAPFGIEPGMRNPYREETT